MNISIAIDKLFQFFFPFFQDRSIILMVSWKVEDAFPLWCSPRKEFSELRRVSDVPCKRQVRSHRFQQSFKLW